MKKSAFVIFGIFFCFALSACELQPLQRVQLPITQEQATQQTATRFIEYSAPSMKGLDIYCNGEKVGRVDGQRIFMKFNDRVVSFDGAFDDNFACYDTNVSADLAVTKSQYITFEVDGLMISTHLYPGYNLKSGALSAGNQTIETPEENVKIAYDCKQSIVKEPASDSSKDAHNYTKNALNYYCQTNGKDFFADYELQDAEGFHSINGYDIDQKQWRKFYLKKNDGVNYIFIGDLEDYSMPPDGISYDPQNPHEFDAYHKAIPPVDYAKYARKSTLDGLLKDPVNKRRMAAWERMMASFGFEPKGTQI